MAHIAEVQNHSLIRYRTPYSVVLTLRTVFVNYGVGVGILNSIPLIEYSALLKFSAILITTSYFGSKSIKHPTKGITLAISFK